MFTILYVVFANILVSNIGLYTENTNNRLLVLFMTALLCYAITQYFLTIYSQAILALFIIREYHERTAEFP